jgi:hypothetical protein
VPATNTPDVTALTIAPITFHIQELRAEVPVAAFDLEL